MKAKKPKAKKEQHPSDDAFLAWVAFLKGTPPTWAEHRNVLRFAFRAGWDRGVRDLRVSS